MNSTIYIDGKDLPIKKALRLMTDDWIDDGQYCAQTVMDMRDILRELAKEGKL